MSRLTRSIQRKYQNIYEPPDDDVKCLDCNQVTHLASGMILVSCPNCGSDRSPEYLLPSDQRVGPTRAYAESVTKPKLESIEKKKRGRPKKSLDLLRPTLYGWARTRWLVLLRDEFRCQTCGISVKDGAKLEVDHKMPRSRGGSDDMSNLQAACFACNRGKHTDAIT